MKQPKRKRAAPARAKKKRARGIARNALIVVGVAAALLAAGFLDRDAGVGHWLDLRRDATAAKGRIAESEARIRAHQVESAGLRNDPLAIEAAIREDLGLARPGEWVVREKDLTSLRNP